MKLLLIALLAIVSLYPVADIAFAMVIAAAFYTAAIVAVSTVGGGLSEPAISL